MAPNIDLNSDKETKQPTKESEEFISQDLRISIIIKRFEEEEEGWNE